MKDERFVWNILSVMSPKPDGAVRRLEDLYKIPVSEAKTPEEDLVLMISKIIHMTDLLASCMKVDDNSILEACQQLDAEIRRHERRATSGLVEQAPDLGKNIFKTVVRFPSRMERISIMLANMLDCCRVKAGEGLRFSDEAQKEITEIFQLVSDMLRKLRDTLMIPDKFLLGQIRFDTRRLEHLIEDARLSNWDRTEVHVCRPLEASLYVEILDSFRNVNEYIGKMSQSLLELSRLQPED